MPAGIRRSTPATAVTRPNRLTRPRVTITSVTRPPIAMTVDRTRARRRPGQLGDGPLQHRSGVDRRPPAATLPPRPPRTASDSSGVPIRTARPRGTSIGTPPAAAAPSSTRPAIPRLTGTSTNPASPVP